MSAARQNSTHASLAQAPRPRNLEPSRPRPSSAVARPAPSGNVPGARPAPGVTALPGISLPSASANEPERTTNNANNPIPMSTAPVVQEIQQLPAAAAIEVPLLMPEPQNGPSEADRARLREVAQATGSVASRQKEMPSSAESTANARRSVTEPQQESDARAQAGLVATLEKRPAPSAAILQLCAEIRRAIRERRPPDEASLLRTNPTDEARRAGGEVTDAVSSDADRLRASYNEMERVPAAAPAQQGQPATPPPSQVNTNSPNAGRATPDGIPAQQVSLHADHQASAQRISEAGMDTPTAQLVQSGPIAEVRNAQDALGQMAESDPAQVLADQVAARAQAEADMQGLERQALAAMRAGRAAAVAEQTRVVAQTATSEEAKRLDASTRARDVFEAARSQVETQLADLPGIAMNLWETGLETLSTAFERQLDVVERWKRERYEQFGGSINELVDDVFGMPSWVIEHYNRAERAFGDGVCRLLTQISTRVNGIVAACEALIERANRDISQIFSALPVSLQEWANTQQAQFQGQLEGLSQRVISARDNLIDELGERGRSAVQEVRERIHNLRQAAGGLLGRIQSAIDQFLADPARFIINGLLELVGIAANSFWALVNRIATVLNDIADDPLSFANNLARAVGQGFQRFFDNFSQHFQNGFFAWLFSGLGAVGVNVPGDFSLSSTITFFMELMGITWDRIRALLVSLVGERNIAIIEQAYEMLSTLIEMGPSGLFEMIKERFNPREMIQEVIQAGVDVLIETLITRVSARLLMMFNPAGAIIQAVEVIYRILEWIFNNAAQIFSLVETIVNGAAALVAGNISGMAASVESALSRLINPVIDFLAGFLGLGDLPDQIADTIRGFQEWLWGIIERVVRSLIDKVRSIIERGQTFASETVDRVRGWWHQRVGFRDAAGEEHSLYFDGEGSVAQLMVASMPQQFRSWLTDLPDSDDKTAALRLYTQLTQAQRYSSDGSNPGTGARGDSASSSGAVSVDEQVTQLTNQLATIAARLVVAGGDVPIPQYGGLSAGGYGTSVVVNNLNSTIPPGSSPSSSLNNAQWDALRLRKDERPDGRSYYIRGHLLNDNIGGPGNSWANLTPITQRANNPEMLNNFETPVKNAVNAGKQVNFEVRVIYGHSLNRNLLNEIQAIGEPLPHILTIKEQIIRAEQHLPKQLTCSAEEVGRGVIKNYRVDNTIAENSLDDYVVAGDNYDKNAEFNDLVNAARASNGSITWTEYQRGKTGRLNYLDRVDPGAKERIRTIAQDLWNARRDERLYNSELERINNIASVITWRAFKGTRLAYKPESPLNSEQVNDLKSAFDIRIQTISSRLSS